MDDWRYEAKEQPPLSRSQSRYSHVFCLLAFPNYTINSPALLE